MPPSSPTRFIIKAVKLLSQKVTVVPLKIYITVWGVINNVGSSSVLHECLGGVAYLRLPSADRRLAGARRLCGGGARRHPGAPLPAQLSNAAILGLLLDSVEGGWGLLWCAPTDVSRVKCQVNVFKSQFIWTADPPITIERWWAG